MILFNKIYLNKHENSPIKVIDYGMNKRFNSKNFLSEKVRTAYYISPEVFQGKYDEKYDIWNAGVILYIIYTDIAMMMMKFLW